MTSVDETREWVDEQIRDLVRMYLDGQMYRSVIIHVWLGEGVIRASRSGRYAALSVG